MAWRTKGDIKTKVAIKTLKGSCFDVSNNYVHSCVHKRFTPLEYP